MIKVDFRSTILPERIYNPITAMGFSAMFTFSWTILRGKNCRHHIAVIRVVDTFGLSQFQLNQQFNYISSIVSVGIYIFNFDSNLQNRRNVIKLLIQLTRLST